MIKSITTLAELEREQEKLKMTMELTRQEFARNLGTNRKQLQGFLVKNVAVPAGAVGVGLAAINKIVGSETNSASNASKADIWKTLLPIGIKLFQAYFMKNQGGEVE